MPGVAEGAVLSLQGDQYRAYTTITELITAFRYTGQLFFVTGLGGTGKSFLLKALQYWCNISHQKNILLAPIEIAARNIDGQTIYSALSIF